MNPQPPRFAARSKILTDLTLSEGARLLYLFLDDQARGEDRLSMKQLRIAVLLGISTRHLRDRMKELQAAGYLRIRHTLKANVYEFERNHSSDSNGNHSSARSGTTVPVLPYSKNLQEPPTPFREDENQSQTQNPPEPGSVPEPLTAAGEADPDRCMFCFGRGVAGFGGSRSTCGVCRGSGKRYRADPARKRA